VSDAIVLSVADRKRDETMAAFLVLKEEKNQSAIRMDLKTRLMIQEMPRHLIICSELPLTAAGKVDRRALLKMLENKGSPIV
jgi:long-chain acyl-CoA synthetase